MKTKYIIKGIINNKVVYYADTQEKLLFNSNFKIFKYCASIDEATLYETYDDALNAIKLNELHNLNIYPVCPICNEEYKGYPAISRKDNKTEICSICGIKEALLSYKKTT